MNVRAIFLVFVSAGMTGCATIISGTTQEVAFHSNPEGATVTVDGMTLGKTPLAFRLKRDKYVGVTFEKEGYKPVTLPMYTKLEGWFWGNILFGGLIGSTTDGISGAAREYAPGQYLVSLEPLSAGRMESETVKDDRQKAREYIVVAYTSIVSELAKGGGDYVRTLLDTLKVPTEGREDAIKKLRALSEAYTNILDFADHAIELYLKPDAPGAPSEDAAAAAWQNLRQGTPKDQYQFLVAQARKTAETDVDTLNETQGRALTDYITAEKGRKYNLSWHFKINAELPSEEKNFILWYLPQYSGYKPQL